MRFGELDYLRPNPIGRLAPSSCQEGLSGEDAPLKEMYGQVHNILLQYALESGG